MAECGVCGATDEMLFACRHCERRFCAAHVTEHGCGDDDGGGEGARAAAVGEGRGHVSETAGGATAAAASSTATRTATGDGDPAPVRPMDARKPPGATAPRRPDTVAGWMRQQTYLTLVVKVGGVALLVSLAFYAGLVFTLYDPMGLF